MNYVLIFFLGLEINRIDQVPSIKPGTLLTSIQMMKQMQRLIKKAAVVRRAVKMGFRSVVQPGSGFQLFSAQYFHMAIGNIGWIGVVRNWWNVCRLELRERRQIIDSWYVFSNSWIVHKGQMNFLLVKIIFTSCLSLWKRIWIYKNNSSSPTHSYI